MMKLKLLVVAAGLALLPAVGGAQETSRSAECPKGCPTSRGAAGLSGVEFLALQQELRDRNCGNARVPGVLDAATRRAIRVCAQRMSVRNNARAVLTAMNIGFGTGDAAPSADAANRPSESTMSAPATPTPTPT
ncbi:MAG: hypothetical protein M3Q89_14790, partial [Verrucomicrobiota bacterium]|nr:hypothetical protein [Verrucomicrobiota bacterium]